MSIQLDIQTKGADAVKALQTEVKLLREEIARLSAESGKASSARNTETESTKKQAKEVSTLARIRREEKLEGREQLFVMNTAREVYGAAALALTTFGLASANGTAAQKKQSEAVNSGFLAFQGLDFAMRAVPYGAFIAGAFGAIVAIKGMVTVTEEEKKKMQELALSVTDLQYKLGLINTEEYKKSLQDNTKLAKDEYDKQQNELQIALDKETSARIAASSTKKEIDLTNVREEGILGEQGADMNLYYAQNDVQSKQQLSKEKEQILLQAQVKELDATKSMIEKEVQFANMGLTKELAINSAKATGTVETTQLQLDYTNKMWDDISAKTVDAYEKEKGLKLSDLEFNKKLLEDEVKYKQAAETNKAVADATRAKQQTANINTMLNERETSEIDYNKSIEMLYATTSGQKAEIERNYTVKKLEQEEKVYKSSKEHSDKEKEEFSNNIKLRIKYTNDLYSISEQLNQSKGFGGLADEMNAIDNTMDRIEEAYNISKQYYNYIAGLSQGLVEKTALAWVDATNISAQAQVKLQKNAINNQLIVLELNNQISKYEQDMLADKEDSIAQSMRFNATRTQELDTFIKEAEYTLNVLQSVKDNVLFIVTNVNAGSILT